MTPVKPPLSPVCLPPRFATLLAIGGALSLAIHLGNGGFEVVAVVLLGAAFALTLMLVSQGHPPAVPAWLKGHGILVAGIALQYLVLLVSKPGIYLDTSLVALWPFRALVLVSALVAGDFLRRQASGSGRWHFVLLLSLHGAIGCWVIAASPSPSIDVYAFHVEAFGAAARGLDPYAITMPDIYGHDAFYGPGLLVDGRLNVGFPYPPLSFHLARLGHLLGDYRYATTAAIVGTAALIHAFRPGPASALAALAFLSIPRTPFVIEQGWTDPFVGFFLAITILLAIRGSVLLFIPLGLLFAIKHYMVIGAPLVLLLVGSSGPGWIGHLRRGAAVLVGAVAVAALVTLPMALLHPRAVVFDLIGFQANQPFRSDSLSFLAAFYQATGLTPPLWLGFASIPPALVLGWRRLPRSPSGFAQGLLLVYLAFFAFGKQAFCNYYFFVAGCAFIAAGALEPASPQHSAQRI